MQVATLFRESTTLPGVANALDATNTTPSPTAAEVIETTTATTTTTAATIVSTTSLISTTSTTTIKTPLSPSSLTTSPTLDLSKKAQNINGINIESSDKNIIDNKELKNVINNIETSINHNKMDIDNINDNIIDKNLNGNSYENECTKSPSIKEEEQEEEQEEEEGEDREEQVVNDIKQNEKNHNVHDDIDMIDIQKTKNNIIDTEQKFSDNNINDIDKNGIDNQVTNDGCDTININKIIDNNEIINTNNIITSPVCDVVQDIDNISNDNKILYPSNSETSTTPTHMPINLINHIHQQQQQHHHHQQISSYQNEIDQHNSSHNNNFQQQQQKHYIQNEQHNIQQNDNSGQHHQYQLHQQQQHIQQQQQQQHHHNHFQQMQLHQQHHQHQSNRHHHHHPMNCIDDLMIDEHHDQDSRYKILSPLVKHENQDDGYETSAGDILTPNSHISSHPITPQHQMHSLIPKCEIPPTPSSVDDPYNFIDDEINNSMHIMSSGPVGQLSLRHQGYSHQPNRPPNLNSNLVGVNNQLMGVASQLIGSGNSILPGNGINEVSVPKKRGRKKKIRDENGSLVNGVIKVTVPKERKKHDRFNGMPEEEVSKRTLPDHLTDNLDIIIIGINPGLFAAYKGHHYAGPGNHFWKCLYLSGLIHEQMTAEEDYKLLDFGIGFTNMVERATKGSADLTRKEIKEGSRILLEKLRKFRPKIAVFNGKLIFEVFSGKKDFNFGRQPECIEGTNTYMWVMPSSSARCAQLPRAADKVPFYAALKKFRDYLNGLIPHLDDSECVFSDPKYKSCCEPEPKTENLGYTVIADISNCNLSNTNSIIGNNNNNSINKNSNNKMNNENGEILVPGKKKRGRPKKIKGMDGCDDTKVDISTRRLLPPININNIDINSNNGGTPKKKRGRPKKIKAGDLLNSNNNMSALNGQLLNNELETMNSTDLNQSNSLNSIICGNLNQNRLFSPPMHSPSTVSSYCPIGMNAPTPPINTNNNTNNVYHHPHQLQHHHHHHQQQQQQQQHHQQLLNVHHQHHQQQQHHLHHHHQQQQQHHLHHHHHHHPHSQQQHQQSAYQHNSQPQYTPHSDLSSEISAAISSERLDTSPAPTSPNLVPTDFEPSNSIHTDDTNQNELRFPSPASTISDHHHTQNSGSGGGNSNGATGIGGSGGNSNTGGGNSSGSINNNNYPQYRNTDSNNSYISNTSNSNDANSGDNYVQQQQQLSPSHQHHSQISPNNSNNNNNNNNKKNNQQTIQITDVATKSLSGLESLVDQIPTMNNDNDGTTTPSSTSSTSHLTQSHTNDNRLCEQNDAYSNNCLYTNYTNNIQMNNNITTSTASSSPSSGTTNSTLISPTPHYTNYSTNLTPTISTSSNSSHIYGNGINSSGNLSSNFSVSSLTAQNYSLTNSYHTNLVNSSPHHLSGGGGSSSSGSSPMYMEPHMPVPVNPLYHPYTQHSGYGGYNHIGPTGTPLSHPLHMPSPNYPYVYGNSSTYPQPGHHSTHPAATAGYLTNHPSMFDRLKPDIGYGGF